MATIITIPIKLSAHISNYLQFTKPTCTITTWPGQDNSICPISVRPGEPMTPTSSSDCQLTNTRAQLPLDNSNVYPPSVRQTIISVICRQAEQS